jgi:VanZ family protein
LQIPQSMVGARRTQAANLRMTLFLGWILLLLLLLMEWIAAWFYPSSIHSFVQSWQRFYGRFPDGVAWYARADGHLHLLSTLTVTIWLALGCAVFSPRLIRVLPAPVAILIALSDEFAQLFVMTRSFEWLDQLYDLIGLVIGMSLIVLGTWNDRAGPGTRLSGVSNNPRD